jgi:NADH dehydrogenase [ubiquinone] 1 alpha subcomplex assembly factor 7
LKNVSNNALCVQPERPATVSALLPLIAREAAQRPLTIARLMEWALQHPEHGYYRQHDPLGVAGDFITAPEISQMFGEMLGLWCVEQWQRLGCPAPFALLELGPGRGTLLADALRAARVAPAFLAALQLYLLESNATLRAKQAQVLAAYNPIWLEQVAGEWALPAVPTLIIANEFFDALPIHQLLRRATGWVERCVGALDGQLGWVDVPAALAALAQLTAAQQALPVDAVAELCPSARVLVKHITSHIVTHGGALLAIDYGYMQPTGSPSFQAVSRHAPVDPLAAPGQADLTAHVDFGALAMAATQAGGNAVLAEQGEFLQALGMEQRLQQLLLHADAAGGEALAAAYRRLTHPHAMGSLFKVLLVTAR